MAFLSAFLFYLLPVLIGRPLVRTFIKSVPSYPFISYFVVGALMLYVWILGGFELFTLLKMPVDGRILLQILLGVLGFILIPLNILWHSDLNIKKYIFPAILSVGLGSVVYALWHVNSPYPLNWDIYEHQTLINNIFQGRLSFISSRITDTFGFNGYSTLFHVLTASAQAFFNVSVLTFWDTMGLLHLILVIFASYVFAGKITGNKHIAAISAILGAFIFDANISFTNLFFLPQTLVAVVFIFLFTQLITEIKKGENLMLPVIIMSSFYLLLNHYVVGGIAFLLYSGTYIYYKFPRLLARRIQKEAVIELGLFVGFIGILFASQLSLGFLNNGEAAAFTLTLGEKYQIMKQSYGFLLLLTLPVGIVTILKRKREAEMLTIIITTILMLLVLSQLPYVMKFYVLTKFFVQLVMAIGIFTAFQMLPNRVFKGITYVLLLITVFCVFIANATVWKGVLHYSNIKTHISNNEIQAANFIKDNYSTSHALLVSDPATQNILEALSGVNSQGGVYMNTDSRLKLDHAAKLKNTALIAKTVNQIHDQIESGNMHLLVLSGKYFNWQKSTLNDKLRLDYNIWNPSNLTLENIEYINALLSDKEHFKLVYQNKTLVVIEVK